MLPRNRTIWGQHHKLHFYKTKYSIFPYKAVITNEQGEIVKQLGYETMLNTKELKRILAQYEEDNIK